jgi:hypothetical protein
MNRTTRFLQSPDDFPLTVSLDNKAPTWGLSRWGGTGLRFFLPDDEGFTLRGNKRQLLYKGRRRNHRFTILGDNSFEYDCILNREPDSNVLTLDIEGSEKFDFFRQPDFIKNPFLAGSYAVYKKETLIGEGTGKLCHIHRPEIIDARGRRVWGDLSVTGGRLLITIPERWLSEAKYPVIVDPTIGSTTVGSLIASSSVKDAYIDGEYAANRFLVSETIKGTCTAHIYIGKVDLLGSWLNPLFFRDENDKPTLRQSENEEGMDGCTLVYNGQIQNKGKHWGTADFSVIDAIESGSSVWFGCRGSSFYATYDYGGILYKNKVQRIYTQYEDTENGISFQYDDSPDFSHNGTEKTYNCLLSWYFTYETSTQYKRTITQWVLSQDSAGVSTLFRRHLTMPVRANDLAERCIGFLSKLVETMNVFDCTRHWGAYIRGLLVEAISIAETSHSGEFYRKQTETVQADGTVFRGLLIFVRLLAVSLVRDYILRRFLKSNEDIVLKSAVCRELEIDSRIH